MKTFLEFVNTFIAFDYAKEKNPDSVLSKTGKGETTDTKSTRFRDNIKKGISNAKVFDIDDNIKKLLILTDTPQRNDEICLPFNSVFLDVTFTKEELAEYGIDIKAKEIKGILAQEGRLCNEQGKTFGKDLNLCILSIQADNWVWFDDFHKNCNLFIEHKDKKIKIEEIEATDSKARDFVHKFFLNFLNFLYTPDVKYIEHARSEKNRQRRMKAGKIPLHSTVSIKITGQLKKYIDDLVNTGNIKCGYSFWVHGHYRNLTAPFYKAKKGQRIFIPPFVKGMGNLIEKNYEVRGMGN